MAGVARRLRLSDWFDGPSRVRTRPIIVLKHGVVRTGGQPFDPSTGVVLAPDEAYETVRIPVEEELLGSVMRTDGRLTSF